MHVLNCRIDPLDFPSVVRRVHELVEERRFAVHSSLNVAKVVRMERDLALREAIAGSDIVSADGMPVVWVSRLFGSRVERVTGCDLLPQLVQLAADRGYPVFFLGARRDVVEELVERYRHRFPGLKVAGARDGYFPESQEPEVARQIAASGARMLFIALPTPRKEMFIHRNAKSLGAIFCMGVGGSFDVETGRVKRAPSWIQRMGGEWLWRMALEPRKLWRRNAETGGAFAWIVLRELWRCAGRKHDAVQG
jgi:N-acetylglucosaminyldiphosphoundecaprenol N-acetyl-beta-D-mannosaminyltransferase